MRNTSNDINDEEYAYINLQAIGFDYLRMLRKWWFLLILLVALCASGMYFYRYTHADVPYYTAAATYTVEKGSTNSVNTTICVRLANGVSTIADTVDFQKQISDVLGYEVDKYLIYAEATTDSNLMTVTVAGLDEQVTDDLLTAFDQIYPSWIAKYMGSCKLTKVDEAFSDGTLTATWSVKKTVAFGALLGAFLWFCFATWGVVTRTKVHDEGDMQRITTSICLGSLPEIKKKQQRKGSRDPLLMTSRHVNSEYSQCVRSVRHQLGRLTDEGKQVFLITSTVSEEGKSLLTMNLAYAFRKTGKSVTVIDADLYRHGVAQLSQTALDTVTLLDYLKNVTLPVQAPQMQDGIAVLPGNRNERVPADALNIERFMQIVNALRPTSDVILIDTPPVGQVGDAILFSEAADAVLYLVRCDYVSIKEIRKGIEPFCHNETLAGYVLNRCRTASGGYGYGYGYGTYGYGYVKNKYSSVTPDTYLDEEPKEKPRAKTRPKVNSEDPFNF